jgi:small-conductance mechanosensitive channel
MSQFLDPRYYIPLFIAVAVYLVLWVVKDVVINRLRKISTNTSTYVDDVILITLDKTKHWFIMFTSVYVGFQTSPFDTKKYGPVADKIYIVIFALQVILWGKQAIVSWLDFELQKKNNDPSVKTTFGFLGLLLKFMFIVAVVLFALNNLGFNVSTFITGLGVGGIAIALATQNILGDLFSSLSIVMDKPFIVGDFINLGEWQGTVEYIGLKTTRIRSISGEQIIISNSDLLASKIRNHKRMSERRVIFQLGITYYTTREQIKAAPRLIEGIIKSEKDARYERAHFMRFGASSLDIEVVYWVTSPEFMIHADLQQRVLLGIHEVFEKEGIEFAYPTQTLYIEKGPLPVSSAHSG